MRIGYFADGPWAHKTLEKIQLDKNIKICFIVQRYDKKDPILKEWSKKLGVDFLTIKNVNSEKSYKKFNDYNADLFVSMSFNQIIKKKLINLPPKGFINCHAGALPFYRGRNVLNWAIINGEKKFGVTVHFIDEGIDTGDIIKQRLYSINKNDNYESILKKAHLYCSQLLFQVLQNFLINKFNRMPQKKIHSTGSYFRGRIDGDEAINWNWNTRKIYDFIRAISSPGPCAQTNILDTRIKVINSRIANIKYKNKIKVGSIIKIKNKNIYVKTLDGILVILEYSIMGKKKISLKKEDCFY